MTTATDFSRALRRLMTPLHTRIRNTVSRIVVDAVNDAASRQLLRVQVLADEVMDPVEHFQPGGLTHVPLAGAEGIVLCVGGSRAHPVAFGVANRDARPTGLQPGETGLYSATTGTGALKIKLDAAGNVILTPTGKVTIAGDLEVTGEVTATSATTPVHLSTHLHPSATGPTGAPTPGS